MNLDQGDRKILLQYVFDLQQYFGQWLFAPVQSKLNGVMPHELEEIQLGLAQFLHALQENPTSVFELKGEFIPFAKLAVEIARRKIAEQQETLRESTVSVEVHRNIDHLLEPIRHFRQSDWFNHCEALRLPPLTDFLTLEASYAVLKPYLGTEPEREFDNKFGILQSQKTFLTRIRYSRVEASLRNTETTVAFADIDNFKTFNQELTETVVDREVLRPVMRMIESHCHSHGEAFQFGGDEYVLLLSNMDKTSSERFLFRLQEKLAARVFSVTDGRIAISVGCCTFAADAHYTDQEILDLATKAKAFAKRRKDCLGVYNSAEHSPESLITRSRVDLVLGAKAY